MFFFRSAFSSGLLTQLWAIMVVHQQILEFVCLAFICIGNAIRSQKNIEKPFFDQSFSLFLISCYNLHIQIILANMEKKPIVYTTKICAEINFTLRRKKLITKYIVKTLVNFIKHWQKIVKIPLNKMHNSHKQYANLLQYKLFNKNSRNYCIYFNRAI